MDAVKRKVISELFFAPSVVLPIVAGATAGLLAWATGSSYLSGAAIIGILGGVGWMITRLIFRVEAITEDVMRVDFEEKRRLENQRLDELARHLRTDRDHRTQDYLTLLRSLRNDVERLADDSGIRMRSANVREKIDQVFHAAIEQLGESFKLWELSENLVGDARKKVLQNREQVLQEVQATIDRMNSAVTQFKELMRREDKVDLSSMADELDATLRVAKRTEERMREIDTSYLDKSRE